MGKSIRLSIVALHSVDGVHQQFKELVKLAEEFGAPSEESHQKCRGRKSEVRKCEVRVTGFFLVRTCSLEKKIRGNVGGH